MRVPHFFTAGQWFGEPREQARDQTAIARWNEVVGPDDLVWVLGGFTAGAVDPAPYARLLHGVKYLVAGPGDNCWAGYGGTPRELETLKKQYTDAGFKGVNDSAHLARKQGRPPHIPLRGFAAGVDLASLPYDPPGEHDPFASWRPKRPRSGPANWLVHGLPTDELVHARQVSVAASLWDFEPVPAEVVAGLIETG